MNKNGKWPCLFHTTKGISAIYTSRTGTTAYDVICMSKYSAMWIKEPKEPPKYIIRKPFFKYHVFSLAIS